MGGVVYWISKEHQITTVVLLCVLCIECTESPKNIKSQLASARTARFTSVLNLQRTSNHNSTGVKQGNALVYWISKEHQITTTRRGGNAAHQCTESPKNIKSQLPPIGFWDFWKCTESPKNIKSQQNTTLYNRVKSVLNLQRTSNHN